MPYKPSGLFSTSLLALSLAACGPSGDSSSLKATIDPLATDFKIGRGIDLISGNALGDCIQTSASVPAFDAQGKEFYLSIAKVESSQDLFNKMGLSAKAKYSNGNAALSGKTSFSEQFAFNKASLFLYISVKVTNPTYTLQDGSLKAEAVNLYRTQGARAFRNACGDEFVRSFNSGGEFISVLEIHTQNELHKKLLEESIKGSYGQVAGTVSFSASLEKAITQNKTDLYIYQSGGSFQHMNLTADDLMKKAASYPESITQANSRPIMAYTASYKTLLNFPSGGDPFEVDEQEDVLNQLAQDDLQLSDLLGNAEYIQENPNEFLIDDSYMMTLSAKVQDIKTSLRTVRTSARSCVSNIDRCQLPSYRIPAFEMPARPNGPVSPLPEPTQPENGGVTGPGAGRDCIIWIDKSGAPFLQPYSEDGGPKRKKHVLPVGETFSFSKLAAEKTIQCLKVENGMQTVKVKAMALGYGDNKTETVPIIHN